jgi:hypothetical protein
VDQCHRGGDPETERIHADALAVEDARMIGFGALAHEGGKPVEMSEPYAARNVDPALDQHLVGFAV